MLLKEKFYTVAGMEGGGLTATFTIRLLPGCDVYRGHFPGHPVCPGVCHIETIRECAMMLTGERLSISTVKRCRFTAVSSPAICPEVKLSLAATPTADGFNVTASLYDGTATYVEYKGDMAVAPLP